MVRTIVADLLLGAGRRILRRAQLCQAGAGGLAVSFLRSAGGAGRRAGADCVAPHPAPQRHAPRVSVRPDLRRLRLGHPELSQYPPLNSNCRAEI